MTPDDALRELATATARSLADVLEAAAPGACAHAEPVLSTDAGAALAEPPVPGLATSVTYADGVTGGNVMLLPMAAAHRLAAAKLGTEPDEAQLAEPLSDSEQAAVAEAMELLMASAAAATSTALGYPVDVAPVQMLPTSTRDLAADYEGSAYATTTAFEICGEPCRFVQLLPHSLVVRMTRALDERAGRAATAGAAVDAVARAALADSLTSTSMRVSVEIGRTNMQVDRLVGLPMGAVIELDHEADDPIDILVNGRRFAVGRLVQTETDEWAVRVERLLPRA